MEAILLAVTLLSISTAIGTSFLAWRVVQAERLRSEARIAALAADLEMDDRPRAVRSEHPVPKTTPVPAQVEPPFPPESDLTAVGGAFSASHGMFAERAPGRSLTRAVAGVGVAAAIVVLVVGTLVMTSDRSTSARSTPVPPQRAAAAAAAPATSAELPLELIALGHERERDRLMVRGVVRGAATVASDSLTAVVLLFNREGREIGSGRAEVAPAGSNPAGERTFVVTAPSAGDVGRYRISFRSGDRVVPHVDKRTAGTTKPPVLNVANSQF